MQKLVDFNYEVVKKYSLLKLFLPFLFFMVFFFVWIDILYPRSNNSKGEEGVFLAFLFCNVVFASYFLINEIRQIAS